MEEELDAVDDELDALVFIGKETDCFASLGDPMEEVVPLFSPVELGVSRIDAGLGWPEVGGKGTFKLIIALVSEAVEEEKDPFWLDVGINSGTEPG